MAEREDRPAIVTVATRFGTKNRIELEGLVVRLFDNRGELAREFGLWEVDSVALSRGFLGEYLTFHFRNDQWNHGHWSTRQYLANDKDEKRGLARLHEMILSERLPAVRRLQARLQQSTNPTFEVPLTTPDTPGCTTYRDLRIGEIERHFDTRTLGASRGTLVHDLSGHVSIGGGFGGGFLAGLLGDGPLAAGSMGGSFGGSGSLSLTGSSTLSIRSQATSRADLLNESLLAVFDRPSSTGAPDTLRVVFPTGELVHSALVELVRDLIPSPAEWAMRFSTSASQSSYAGDRLAAITRLRPDPAPLISVVGAELAPHLAMGYAIQFQGSEDWVQLFPMGLIAFITD